MLKTIAAMMLATLVGCADQPSEHEPKLVEWECETIRVTTSADFVTTYPELFEVSATDASPGSTQATAWETDYDDACNATAGSTDCDARCMPLTINP